MRRWLLLVLRVIYLGTSNGPYGAVFVVSYFFGVNLLSYLCPRVIYHLTSIQGCKPLLLSDLSLFIGPKITVWVHFLGQFYSLMSLCSITHEVWFGDHSPIYSKLYYTTQYFLLDMNVNKSTIRLYFLLIL